MSQWRNRNSDHAAGAPDKTRRVPARRGGGSRRDGRSENVLMVSQDTRHSPTVGPAVPLLGVHPRETRTSAHANTCPRGF